MKLNRKLWTAALAVAMTTPSAMAAQDTAGMQYTSAAEGFYASIRVRFNANGGGKEGASNIGNSGSRFGIRGTNDLGGGLEGFYQYEMGVSTENGDKEMSTRVGLVGLRGDFGAIVGGSFWTDSYNWVYGSTDIANVASGNFAYGEFGQGRSKKSVQYTTPDLNGFQGALLVQMDSTKDGEGTVGSSRVIDIDYVVSTVVVALPATLVVGDPVTHEAQLKTVVNSPIEEKNAKDDTDVDHWSLAAAYNIAGFSMGASYSVFPDASAGLASKYTGQLIEAADNNDWDAVGFDTRKDDMTAWAVKLGYSQDNWYVNSWYGTESTDEIGGYTLLDFYSQTVEGATVLSDKIVSIDDTEVFSIAGGISVDKVNVYALYENKEHDFFADKDSDGEVDAHVRGDDSYYTLGLQYSLGSRSRVWAEYAGQDLDSSENEDGDFNIGLRHDF